MGRTGFTAPASPYYPQRARWYNPLLNRWAQFRRALRLDRLRIPDPVSPAQLLLCLAVPGWAFILLGKRMAGWSVLAGHMVCALMFLAALGYAVGDFMFGLVISAHAASVVFLEAHCLRKDCRFRVRLALAAATLLAVWQLIYAPLLGLMERHWATPLREGDRVIVVSPRMEPALLKRGDWMAYRIAGGGLTEVYIRAGVAFGPVLATGGDRLEFGANTFRVNGVAHQHLPFMPLEGELVVPENHWFVWPNLAINGRHASVSDLMLRAAIVNPEQFVGIPFKRWFWRRQTVS
jgi:hypothetical protein